MKKKTLTLPELLIKYVDRRRKKSGIGFSEYIRNLIIKDIFDNQ